ncbi:hypothetical protein COHA_007662 [Chlorella ohadii]|uniref:Uncharacterized protein n=1 Tax=Chlorella ohadii TaxID=2649997 RepID=A0AAD5DLX2_9CHLO|nr:hypothetical protein COHA_007662 [Chlorella ohadii]
MQVAMRASAALSVALLLAAATAPAAAVLNSGGVTAMSLRGPVLNALGQPLLTPSNFTMLGRAVYYEIPVRPVAVLALFHGCAHDSSDFWPRAACADCDGLPEEVAHTKQALARGYAVMAIDAGDPSRCFGIHVDQAAVVTILNSFLKRPYQGNQTLQSRPLYLAGVSSGAAFALKLPMALGRPVAGVISGFRGSQHASRTKPGAEVLGVLPSAWNMDSLGANYPPTLFVSMPRDLKTADRIKQDMDLLKKYNVPTDMVLVYSQPLSLDFISNRSELISPNVVAALQTIGLVDSNLIIKEDPRYTKLPWRQELLQMVPELSSAANDSLVPDASAVSEELNRAYANHEIVGDYLTACLAWFEAGGSLPLAGLVQQFGSIALPGERLRDLTPQRLRMLPMKARKLVAGARLTVAVLVCKRWRRLVTCPDVLRLGVAAAISKLPHQTLERVQSLRRWLTRHAGGLRSLDISLAVPTQPPAESKAAQAELGRCWAVACGAGAVQHLAVRWLDKTQLKLGPELAACGACASMRSLTIDGGSGDVHVACPLSRLTALQDCELRCVTKWSGAAALPPSITQLSLHRVAGDQWHTTLPSQVRSSKYMLASQKHRLARDQLPLGFMRFRAG